MFILCDAREGIWICRMRALLSKKKTTRCEFHGHREVVRLLSP